ncbi:MAG: substrate-binding domain-containing protein [Lachnospiraceae bacterium]
MINRIFMENPDMDGIFASSDIIAAQCIQMAGTLGYRIPEDIKIVGYDDICLSRLLYPPLTTVHQDIKGLAKTAMDTVEELIEGKQVPESQVVSVSFIERKTT